MVFRSGLGYDRPGPRDHPGDSQEEDADRDDGDLLDAVVGGLGRGDRGGPVAEAARRAGDDRPAREPFGFALNTSTISGQKLRWLRRSRSSPRPVTTGSSPGFARWTQHVKDGGKLADLGKRRSDLSLKVVDVIGFFEWAVDDEGRRKKGLEEARRNMEMVRAGGRDPDRRDRRSGPPIRPTSTSGRWPSGTGSCWRSATDSA